MIPELSLSPPDLARWRPGASAAACHAEVFAPADEASGSAFTLALAVDWLRQADRVGAGYQPDDGHSPAEVADQRAWLWVQDKAALRRSGRPYQPGLPADLRHRLIHVAAAGPEDALFAVEEGLRCRDLAFVIAEIAGNPRALDFTSSRRLSLAVERHGVPLWLIRLDAARDLASARMRWQVCAAPSPWPQQNAQAPGAPTWRAELFRSRMHIPGEWILRNEGGPLHAVPPHHGDLAGPPADRPLAAV